MSLRAQSRACGMRTARAARASPVTVMVRWPAAGVASAIQSRRVRRAARIAATWPGAVPGAASRYGSVDAYRPGRPWRAAGTGRSVLASSRLSAGAPLAARRAGGRELAGRRRVPGRGPDRAPDVGRDHAVQATRGVAGGGPGVRQPTAVGGALASSRTTRIISPGSNGLVR